MTALLGYLIHARKSIVGFPNLDNLPNEKIHFANTQSVISSYVLKLW